MASHARSPRRGVSLRRTTLDVAAAQPACIAYDVAANAESHAEVIKAAGAHIVAFPELSLTGYQLDAAAVAPSDERLSPIVDACAATGSVALVGAPTHDSGGDRISMFHVDGSGATAAYHKMWLSDVEARRFVPGSSPVVIDIDGWRLGLAICKDTGIAEHADATAGLGMRVCRGGARLC